MTTGTPDHLATIASHSAGFAAAARGNLDAPVEHCPGWSVADLVAHLTDVHWFWGTIVEDRLDAPPDEERRPPRAPDDQLVAAFEQGAARLVRVLGDADPQATVWTWAPSRNDVAFVVRHQAQEAAVHHADAEAAAGRSLAIEPEAAADAIDEFLTFSVSSPTDPAEPARPALDGAFTLACTDLPASWTVSDGGVPGTVVFEEGGAAGAPVLRATASDLLLWLYGRRILDDAPVPGELLSRFRALCFTD